MTWGEFKAGVRTAYWTAGSPTDAQKYRAIADYAHSLFVRQTESDLPLAKSFSDSYGILKLRLAGSRLTGTDDQVKAAVRALLPVDADTDGAQDMLDNAILQARDDFNGTDDRFDVEILNCAIDLQRHVSFYEGRNETVYTSESAGISNQGFITKVDLPADFRIQQVWTARLHDALAADVAYEAGDIVESNGRAYKVIVGGTLTSEQIGYGLTSQDGADTETLGDLEFKYHCDLRLIPVRELKWGNREILFAGRYKGGPIYVISPQFEKLWLYPPLIDDGHFFMLEWTSVKTEFDDADVVTFDAQAIQAAAQFVRAILAKDGADDGKAAASALALYQANLRKCVIDNQARETGTTSTTSDLLYINLGGVIYSRWRPPCP